MEPLANAIHAFRLAQVYDSISLRVGVIGEGTLGFLIALTAADRGVPFIAISDLSIERRASAMLSGATQVSAGLEGEFDIVLDAVGSSSTRRQSLELLCPGGTADWVGLHGADPGFDGLSLICTEKRVLGTFCYQNQDFRAAFDRVATLSAVGITTFPLEQGADVFQRLVDGDVSSVKSVLIP